MNQFEEAEHDLLTAMKLDNSNINVIHHLANVRDKLNKTDLAIENYKR